MLHNYVEIEKQWSFWVDATGKENNNVKYFFALVFIFFIDSSFFQVVWQRRINEFLSGNFNGSFTLVMATINACPRWNCRIACVNPPFFCTKWNVNFQYLQNAFVLYTSETTQLLTNVRDCCNRKARGRFHLIVL